MIGVWIVSCWRKQRKRLKKEMVWDGDLTSPPGCWFPLRTLIAIDLILQRERRNNWNLQGWRALWKNCEVWHFTITSMSPPSPFGLWASLTSSPGQPRHFYFSKKISYHTIPYHASFRVWWMEEWLCRICKTWGTAMTPCFPPPQQPPAVLMVGFIKSFIRAFYFMMMNWWSIITEFSESLRDMGSCLLQKTALNDHGDETGTPTLLLLSVTSSSTHLITFSFLHLQENFSSCLAKSSSNSTNSLIIMSLPISFSLFFPFFFPFLSLSLSLFFSSLFSFPFQRSHIFQTITIPSESLLNELRIVEVSISINYPTPILLSFYIDYFWSFFFLSRRWSGNVTRKGLKCYAGSSFFFQCHTDILRLMCYMIWSAETCMTIW